MRTLARKWWTYAVGCALILLLASLAQPSHTQRSIIGTWSVALDTTPFGVPGLALSGLATFHRDGTLLIVDGGDFGQAEFLGRQHLPQFGAWKRVRPIGRGERRYVATSLFLEANLDGDVTNWQRVQFELVVHGEEMTGSVDVSILPCDAAIPAPTPLTCPDPIENDNAFTPLPPSDVPVTFRRLEAGR